MKFCLVVPQTCRGQVHVPKKRKEKEKKENNNKKKRGKKISLEMSAIFSP